MAPPDPRALADLVEATRSFLAEHERGLADAEPDQGRRLAEALAMGLDRDFAPEARALTGALGGAAESPGFEDAGFARMLRSASEAAPFARLTLAHSSLVRRIAQTTGILLRLRHAHASGQDNPEEAARATLRLAEQTMRLRRSLESWAREALLAAEASGVTLEPPAAEAPESPLEAARRARAMLAHGAYADAAHVASEAVARALLATPHAVFPEPRDEVMEALEAAAHEGSEAGEGDAVVADALVDFAEHHANRFEMTPPQEASERAR